MAESGVNLEGHIPPHNIEAEQACLGSCLIDPEAFDKASAILGGADDFYRVSHGIIFSSMLDLAENSKNIDIITVSSYLKDHGQLENCGGAAYLDGLISLAQSSAFVANYAQIVADKATERRLQQAGNEIVGLALQGEEEAKKKVDHAEELILAVGSQRARTELMPLKEMLGVTFEKLYERYVNHETITGVATGFTDLDEITGGLQPGNLIVLGARPSMGKTAFAMSIAINVALNKEKPGVVAVFSLEMSHVELCQRVMGSVAKINVKSLRTGELNDSDWQSLTQSLNELNAAQLYIDDQSGTSVLEMKAKLRRLKKRVGLDLVVIDYLQLIQGSGRTENRVNELSEISRQLKGMAKEFEVPVVALSQLSRQVENRPDKRPQLSDLRESGAIEQDADLVAFIYRDYYYNKQNEEKRGTAEIIIAKQRNGPVGTVELAFVEQYAGFGNLAKDFDSGYTPPRRGSFTPEAPPEQGLVIPL